MVKKTKSVTQQLKEAKASIRELKDDGKTMVAHIEKLTVDVQKANLYVRTSENIIASRDRDILEALLMNKRLKAQCEAHVENHHELRAEMDSRISGQRTLINNQAADLTLAHSKFGALSTKLENSLEHEKVQDCMIMAQRDALQRYQAILEHHLNLFGFDAHTLRSKIIESGKNLVKFLSEDFDEDETREIAFVYSLWAACSVPNHEPVDLEMYR